MNKKHNIVILLFVITILLVCLCSCSKDETSEDIVEISVKFYIGEELYQEGTYKTGDLIYAPEITEYNGYTISYWAIGNGWVMMPYTAGKEDIVFTAVTYKEVKVLYYSDSDIFYSAIGMPGEKLMAPYDTPVKVGYTFKYWTINNEKATFPYLVSENDTSIVFSAYFVKDCQVKFYVDDVLTSTKTVPYGTTVTPPSNPSIEKYNFVCWQDSNGNLLDTSKSIITDESYYAVFEEAMYEVNYYIDGSLYQKLIVSEYAPNINYTNAKYFYGWYKDSSYKEKFDFNQKITSNINVFGKVIDDDYQVLYNQFGSSSSITISSEDIESFENSYNFDNYKTVAILTLNKTQKSANISYKSQRANKKYVIISYNLMTGIITASYGSSIDGEAYSYTELQVSMYKYSNIDFNVFTILTYNEGSYVSDLQGLALDIAKITFTQIHEKYTSYLSGYDSTLTYDNLPSFDVDCSIVIDNGVIKINSDTQALSIKVLINDKVVSYSTDVKQVEYNASKNFEYTVVVKYIYEYDGKRYMSIITKIV